MTRTVVLLGLAIALWPQGQTFRTTTDVVTVDVSVRSDGRAVTGLTAKDFVLLDNGVRQRIDALEAAEVPIDLTIVVDVSGESYGTWDARSELTKMKADIQAELSSIAKTMRAADRVRVLGVDTYATEIVPMQAPASIGSIRDIAGGGMSSLYETLVAALVQPVEPGRRHIILARTKGIDTISPIDAIVVRDAAARSDAQLHIVGMSTAFLNEAVRKSFQCVQIGLCQPTRRFWQPFRHVSFQSDGLSLTPAGKALADAARTTGGAFHVAQLLNEPTLAGTFRRVFDDFRRSYVLQYTPQGIRREGWHAIDVTVPGAAGATVQAKRGYAVEVATAPATPRRRPDRGVALADLVEPYGKEDYAAMRKNLARVEDMAAVIGELRKSGNPWPASPRREAVFVLELAETGLFSRHLADRDAAAALLGTFHRLIRHPLEPDVFERYWLWAELAIAQGMVRSTFAEPLVTNALTRFPEEPRFVLARAIITDQAWPMGMAVSTTALHRPVRPTDAHISEVIERYTAAIAHAETAPEARVRLAWFLNRIGRAQEALTYLDAVADESGLDAPMRYMYRLFRGHVLSALGRTTEAIGLYREALAIAPQAQSARVSIMNALLRIGDRRGAEQIAEQIQSAGADAVDPWWQYVQGDFRLYPLAIARLRELAR